MKREDIIRDIHGLDAELAALEEQYGLLSADFYHCYRAREMEQSRDFIRLEVKTQAFRQMILRRTMRSSWPYRSGASGGRFPDPSNRMSTAPLTVSRSARSWIAA